MHTFFLPSPPHSPHVYELIECTMAVLQSPGGVDVVAAVVGQLFVGDGQSGVGVVVLRVGWGGVRGLQRVGRSGGGG